MAKITDFETPMGTKGNILKPGTWIPLILGSLVLLVTFSAAEKAGKFVSGKVPLLNSSPTYPFASNTPPPQQPQMMTFQ